MVIIYDLQKVLENINAGGFVQAGAINARRRPFTTATIEIIEDVKSILVTNRENREEGLDIRLSSIPNIRAGDRITITGRIGEGIPVGSSWSIALLAPGGGHLVHQIAPDSVYSLSHILEPSELKLNLFVHTIGWGMLPPLMDFFVDGIIITRKEVDESQKTDTRTVVYSLSEDPGVQWADAESDSRFGNTVLILRAGKPKLHIFRRGNANAIHVGMRFNDFDGIDINLTRMNLLPGNKYRITVTGRADGDVPEKSTIMMQGIPSYTWRSDKPITTDQEFTLQYTLNQSEVETWTAIRITTNTVGAGISFYIYNIDIVRL
ncbi:MAG: hypothetical protein FWF79_06635 [Defluviitaleaceae bacterium]|nr:hypothetical protein [Defluviitaleaceae bacterium]